MKNYDPMFGDTVVLKNDESATKYIVLDKKKIGESMLIDILEYDDTKENPHSGWFNIDKVELVVEYPTIINRIHQDELKNKFNLGLSEI